jgi:hypothetical protein
MHVIEWILHMRPNDAWEKEVVVQGLGWIQDIPYFMKPEGLDTRFWIEFLETTEDATWAWVDENGR